MGATHISPFAGCWGPLFLCHPHSVLVEQWQHVTEIPCKIVANSHLPKAILYIKFGEVEWAVGVGYQCYNLFQC